MLAPLESAVVAPGVVSVETNVKTVQHLEGGIVDAILVRDGDKVAAGDVLVRLQNTLPVSALNEVQAQYFEARATEARLVAERDGKAAIDFPEELRRRAADEAVQDAIAGQESIFRSRSAIVAQQQLILDRTVAGLEAQIAGLEGQIAAARKRIALIDDELTGALALHEQGLMIKSQVLELQRDRAEFEGDASGYLAEVGRRGRTSRPPGCACPRRAPPPSRSGPRTPHDAGPRLRAGAEARRRRGRHEPHRDPLADRRNRGRAQGPHHRRRRRRRRAAARHRAGQRQAGGAGAPSTRSTSTRSGPGCR